MPRELVPAVERLIAQHRSAGGSPTTLDYARPLPIRRPITDVPLTILLCFFAGAWMFLFCFVIPRIERILADFGTKLPALTQCVLWVGRWTRSPLGWIPLWLLALALPVAVARWFAPPDARPSRRWALYVLLSLFLLAAIFTACIAAILPLANLISAVSGK